MKTIAAVLIRPGQQLELADLSIPALKAGQVLVEMRYSGVCHTQVGEVRGHRGEDRFLPHCLGHEGSGIVRETGPGVSRVKPDDAVILSWIKSSGYDVPGCVYDWKGKAVNAGGITTFATFTIASENRLTVMPQGLSPRLAALVGCAIPTGAGVIFNTARPQPGDSLAVFGVGGIGSCAVAAAAVAGCTPIIAVDIADDKLVLARALGATHTIRSNLVDAVQEIHKLVRGGVDVAIEATGIPLVMQHALASVRSQGGTAVVVGNAKFGEKLEIDPRELNAGKRLLGTWGGDNVPDRDYPRYCRLLSSGRLDLEPLLTRTYKLTEVNSAIDDLERGLPGRPLIELATAI